MIYFIVMYFVGCIATVLIMIVLNHLWFKRDVSFMGSPLLEETLLLIVCSWLGCALVFVVFLFDISCFVKDKISIYINSIDHESEHIKTIKKVLGIK
jgi:multisubunit Na+/H+ antiporter MnhB subunit